MKYLITYTFGKDKCIHTIPVEAKNETKAINKFNTKWVNCDIIKISPEIVPLERAYLSADKVEKPEPSEIKIKTPIPNKTSRKKK